MPLNRWPAIVTLLLTLSACGSDEATLVLEVELDRYQIPLQMNQILIELTDTQEFATERTHPVSVGQAAARIAIVQGPQTPRLLTVVVHAMQDDTRIGQTPAETFAFKDGERVELTVSF